MLRWKGNGFVPGIPARDLSDEEVEKYGGIGYLLKTGCYAPDEEVMPVVERATSKMARVEKAVISNK